jgi:uncharacterized protein (DUF4415 family)
VSKKPTPTSWIDPDDAPDVSTPEWRAKFARAPLREGDKIVRRGRPALDKPKQAVSLRLDADVLARFRAAGPGWQTQINDALRRAAKLNGQKTAKAASRPVTMDDLVPIKPERPSSKAKASTHAQPLAAAAAAAKGKLRRAARKGPAKRAAVKRRA